MAVRIETYAEILAEVSTGDVFMVLPREGEERFARVVARLLDQGIAHLHNECDLSLRSENHASISPPRWVVLVAGERWSPSVFLEVVTAKIQDLAFTPT